MRQTVHPFHRAGVFCFARFQQPLMSNVSHQWNGIASSSILPDQIAWRRFGIALWRATELAIIGRASKALCRVTPVDSNVSRRKVMTPHVKGN